MPRDRIKEGGDAMEGDSSIRIPGFLLSKGMKGMREVWWGGQERCVNNILGNHV